MVGLVGVIPVMGEVLPVVALPAFALPVAGGRFMLPETLGVAPRLSEDAPLAVFGVVVPGAILVFPAVVVPDEPEAAPGTVCICGAPPRVPALGAVFRDAPVVAPAIAPAPEVVSGAFEIEPLPIELGAPPPPPPPPAEGVPAVLGIDPLTIVGSPPVPVLLSIGDGVAPDVAVGSGVSEVSPPGVPLASGLAPPDSPSGAGVPLSPASPESGAGVDEAVGMPGGLASELEAERNVMKIAASTTATTTAPAMTALLLVFFPSSRAMMK